MVCGGGVAQVKQVVVITAPLEVGTGTKSNPEAPFSSRPSRLRVSSVESKAGNETRARTSFGTARRSGHRARCALHPKLPGYFFGSGKIRVKRNSTRWQELHIPRVGTDMGSDDSKFRSQDARTRSQLLFTAFVVGLLSGFLVAQGAYLKAHQASSVTPPASMSPKMGPPSSRPNKALLKVLKKVAPKKEVLITISNKNMMEGAKMLEIWLETVKASGVKNYLVVALDKQLEGMLKAQNMNVFLNEIDFNTGPQANTGNNHAISAKKYGIIKEFLVLGWNVLLSDTDIAVLKNPFDYLYRDHDVEAMTDGFDKPTAYGTLESIDDPSMGWSRFAQFEKHFNLNSGLFYLTANSRTIDLMHRLNVRLAKEKYWDQSAFNEEIFFLSHGDYTSPKVTVRVMDINMFMNSKYLFKFVRHMPKAEQPDPVMVHINYHPDKPERMKAVIKKYALGDEHALDPFPGGSEPGS